MLTVHKIGGTSMTKFGEVVENIVIRQAEGENYYNRIFVVSAYSNVTNWLLEHKKTGEPGVYELFEKGNGFVEALADLLQKLVAINRTFESIGLDQRLADAFITDRIKQSKNYLDSLSEVLASGYVNKSNILLAAREILASIGEAHSAFNSVNILQNRGINAHFTDLCGFNDSEYLTIDERIHKAFRDIDTSKTLPFATGYTKGTEGIMREFDRGYSEVTFSKIAVETKAAEAVIHKEYHLSSADPNIVGVEHSRPVGQTNYNVADQLADIGMEAIHPKASKPLELSGINIRIKNTFEPDHPGTLITRDYRGEEAKVEIISGTDQVVALEIHDPLMVGQVGFDLKMMQLIERYNISYILKATNANSITMVVWEKDISGELVAELKQTYYEVTEKQAALVCALGTNIARPGSLAAATTALHLTNINIEAVSQSLKQVNMQFVIGRNDYKNAVIALNSALCG
ncbi:MAG: aspartate kinase [Bacteroidales bacterium]|nr:aspartate kinase [Bacteroidales bacterium]MDT8430473.1 aspartate kinase [Bacteroidales bacterium]